MIKSMLKALKERIDRELIKFIRETDKLYLLSKISPVLFKSIKHFVLRKGKRLRPIIFVIGYLSFAKKTAPGLYRSALSIELLHDFLLVHDDIIDKSDLRRGKPSLHIMLSNYLKGAKFIKFNGQDLAIIAGDVLYAMAIEAFLSIKEDLARKEQALKKLIEATVYTEGGEFIELLSGIKDIAKIKKEDIYKIYDYKTAYYTFASPLVIGAILAGAKKDELQKLLQYGIYLGRAFQIKDDILGMFGEEKKIGKSVLADLQEAKKTILIWYAYHHSNKENKLAIRRILSKEHADKEDLLKMRKVIVACGGLEYSQKEITKFLREAQAVITSSKMRTKYKAFLKRYCEKILDL